MDNLHHPTPRSILKQSCFVLRLNTQLDFVEGLRFQLSHLTEIMLNFLGQNSGRGKEFNYGKV